MDAINAVLGCFGLADHAQPSPPGGGFVSTWAHQGSNPTQREEQLAADIYQALRTAEKPGASLRAQIDGLVHADSWSENIAKRILDHVAHNLQPERMGPAMREAYEKAEGAARAFVAEHPVFVAAVVTVIAIGILVVLVPWVVEALGFGELGPIEGSFAAWWQSTFPDVEAGSFFSFLQRLGMRWGKA